MGELRRDVRDSRDFADGNVGLLYLHGSGKIEFTEVEIEKKSNPNTIPTKHSVDIIPGRMVVWSNRRLLHRIVGEKGQARIFIGPAIVDSGVLSRVGEFWCEQWGEENTCPPATCLDSTLRPWGPNAEECCMPCTTCQDWEDSGANCSEPGTCVDPSSGTPPSDVADQDFCCK